MYIYMIYYKELVYVIMEAEKFPRSALSKLETKES